ncbi:M10 family metallopeptidase [Tritonibacter mobilis]|uniref:M10 family metallopeptidase n=1 Tax=Tritonibacter mobilis TaxID=379347 RepID=UPI003BAB009C
MGDTFTGTRSSAGDDDWVAITLTAGETYVFDLDGSSGGGGTLSDTDLYLYNAAGTELAYDDLSGEGLDAELTFEATYTGTYYIGVSSYSSSNTGSYTLTVDQDGPASLDELADFLTDGYWEGTFRSGRSFDTSGSNQITVNITGLTAAGQQLARWAFEAWERVADLEFVETTSSSAKITFDDAASGAYAQSVVSGGTILSSVVNVSTSWLSYYGTDIDTYSFQTYVHEIGHALGLGHQGAYNGNATYGTDETFINDSWQLSVMSYFDQVDNTTTGASFGYIVSTMMADIVAIQTLYGAPDEYSETAGDTTWGANTTLTDSYLSEVFGALEGDFSFNMTGNDFALTIYDVSGTDTIDLSPNTTNDRIDLNDESFSDVAGRIGNVGIARGTVIENVIAGSGNDTITGNEADNQISAGAGDDVVLGNGGNDILNGYEGNDILTGGDGADTFIMSLGGMKDIVTDFTVGLDHLEFLDDRVFYSTLTITETENKTHISTDAGEEFTLEGISASSISRDDFTFNSINEFEYIASYADLLNAFGADGRAGAMHFLNFGREEGRTASFDSLNYIASYGDLIRAFGSNEEAGTLHYIKNGYDEGRSTSFDSLNYIASYSDLIRAFGSNEEAGTLHYIKNGYEEGRSTSFDSLNYIASYDDLISAFGDDEDAGTTHYISNGYREGRRSSFDAEQYLENYEDLQLAFGENLEAATLHYIQHGALEGRTDDFIFS